MTTLLLTRIAMLPFRFPLAMLPLCTTLLGVAGWALPVGASEICEAIRAELADTPVVIGNASVTRSFSGAITRQNFEIRKTRQNLMRLGCTGSVSRLDDQGHDVCGDMEATLQQMEDNKQGLIDQMNEASRQGGINPRRRQLEAGLRENNCNDEIPGTTLAQGDQDGVYDLRRPYEAPVYPDYPASSDAPIASPLPEPFGLSGRIGYRTLCVRTCDGGFFPISPNTAPADFGRDADQCRRLCPGTETELYYSRITDEAEAMISSVTGQAYRNLPTAFAYRNRPSGGASACSCNLLAPGQAVTTPAGPSSERVTRPSTLQQTSSSVATVTTPRLPPTPAQPLPTGSNRTDPTPPPADGPPKSEGVAAKPEDRATAGTGAAPPAIDPALGRERSYDPAARTVRQVGPVYLPSQSPTIDLANPAVSGAQPLQNLQR